MGGSFSYKIRVLSLRVPAHMVHGNFITWDQPTWPPDWRVRSTPEGVSLMLGICWLAKWGQAEEALKSQVKEWDASKQGCIRAGPSVNDFGLFGFGFLVFLSVSYCVGLVILQLLYL